jgi:predicted TIM-barrel fold metal-dependent hydrolase
MTDDFSQDDLEIVDAHHHLWDLSRNHYPWLQEEYPESAAFLGPYESLCHDYMPAEYRKDAGRHKVVKTVHVEAEMARDKKLIETRWLEEVAAEHGMPHAIVGHAWVDRPESAEILAAHAASPMMRSIRSKPVTSKSPKTIDPGAPGTMGDPKWRDGFRLLQENGLSYDLRVPYWHLSEAAGLIDAFPDTHFILNHAGLPWNREPDGLNAWRTGMKAVASYPNVDVKMSFLCVKDRPWRHDENEIIVRDTIEIFGVDRCLFASNFPVDSLWVDFDTMYTSYKRMVADLPRADQEKLFSKNAIRAYRIAD